jgi:hypothetical protein
MGMNRNQKVEFNFDSLTDCITNLAGSLILVTLIIFGLTKPKESGGLEPEYRRQSVGGDASMAALLHELDAMRTDLQRIHRDMGDMNGQLPEMTVKLDDLEAKLKRKPR